MTSKIFSIRQISLLLISFILVNSMMAQSKEGVIADKVLHNEMAQMDSILFEAYNTQNIEKLKTLFTEDLEWYQDNGGLLPYSMVLNNFKTIFDRFKSLNTPIRRDLVQGSLEVHPIKDYGAIHIGKHTFCHWENGKNDCGTIKFLMIWQKKEGIWKVSRVVSYDH